MPEKHEIVTTTIRIPKELLDRVDDLAAGNRRSRNAELVTLIEAAVEASS